MKQAISELNLTVVIVVAVAGLVAFFGGVIWPSLRSNINNSANCSDAVCVCDKDAEFCDCTLPLKHENYHSAGTFQCPNKG